MKRAFLYKIGLILLQVFLIISCEPGTQYNYFITNKCDKNIQVLITDKSDDKIEVEVESYSEKLVYLGKGLGHVFDSYVEMVFKEIIITKEDDISKINYLNKNLWRFEPTSKVNANVYLTVNPEDFEK